MHEATTIVISIMKSILKYMCTMIIHYPSVKSQTPNTLHCTTIIRWSHVHIAVIVVHDLRRINLFQ